MTYDAIIVGARVAGAATALQLARGGARVLLIDRATQIGDTMSTHALMRPAVRLLDDLGISEGLLEAGTPSVEWTDFQYGSDIVRVPIKPSGRAGGLLAPRRWLLDRLLVEAAVAAGVELRLGTSFEGALFDETGKVLGARLSQANGRPSLEACDVLIGADGRMSRVAKAVSSPVLAETMAGAATVYGYFGGLETQGYHWMFDTGIQAGIIPTTGGAHCVFVSCPRAEFKSKFANPMEGLVAGIAQFDKVTASQMAVAGPIEALTRFNGAPGILRTATGAGWALVGDSGFFKDPATAHGISDALLDSFRLSQTLLSGRPLEAFEDARNRHAHEMLRLSSAIGELNWSLEALQAMHMELNICMKAEMADLASEAPAQKAA